MLGLNRVISTSMIERGRKEMGHLINATKGWSSVRGIRVGMALFLVDVRILGEPGD